MAPNSVRSIDVARGSTREGVSDATRNANSISELITTIPMTWRSACGAQLTSVYRAATKLCTVQNTIAQYERHVAEGSFPTSIRNSFKDPHVQFSKEFLGSEEGTLVKGLFESEVHSARKSLLACALLRKKEELAALQKLTQFDEEKWRNLVAEVAIRAAAALGLSVSGSSNSSAPPTWTEGSLGLQASQDCNTLWRNGSTFHFRAVAIARSIADRTLVQRTKQLTLKQETDVAMKDADMDRSTRDVVRDEMQAQIRLLKTELSKIGQRGKPANKPRKGKNGGVNKNPVNKRKKGKKPSSRKNKK